MPKSSSNNVKLAGEEAVGKMYESKQNRKLIRVLTVIIYVFSVSLAAIILSLYYMFFWQPQPRNSTHTPVYFTHHHGHHHQLCTYGYVIYYKFVKKICI